MTQPHTSHTNPDKERMKVCYTGKVPGSYIESYVYQPGFFRFNWHPYYELLTVLQGRVQVYKDGKSFIMEPEDVLLLNPQEGHATLAREPDSLLLLLHLAPEVVGLMDREGAIPRFRCRSSAASRQQLPFVQLRYYMSRIYMALSEKAPGSEMEARGSSAILCSLLVRHFPMGDKAAVGTGYGEKQIQRLRQIFDYTDRHYTERITLADLTAETGLNATYLSAMFRQCLGISYYEYLTRKRLQHAVHLLNNQTTPTLDIALAAGFPDVRSLNTAFRRYFDMTPGSYRRDREHPCEFHTPYPRYLDLSDARVREKLESYTRRFR